jgi:hypothetical protein
MHWISSKPGVMLQVTDSVRYRVIASLGKLFLVSAMIEHLGKHLAGTDPHVISSFYNKKE